jgi:hypothetical protein
MAAWPAVLERLDKPGPGGGNGGGIVEAVELREAQDVRVYSESKKVWSEKAFVKAMLPEKQSATVRYMVPGGKWRVKDYALDHKYLEWTFRGSLDGRAWREMGQPQQRQQPPPQQQPAGETGYAL